MTVIIVDGHPVVRDGLQAILSSEPLVRVVGETGDAAEALQIIPKLRPGVVGESLTTRPPTPTQARLRKGWHEPDHYLRLDPICAHDARSRIQRLEGKGPARAAVL